jgi:branched-chain amino acid transport system permease protein
VRAIAVAVFVVAIALLPRLIPQFVSFEFTYVGAYAIAIVGLVILIGKTGQISLGHGAFMAVGGYAVAILSTFGIGYAISIPVAAIAAAVLGVGLGVIALRLAGVYLALATFALAASIPPLIKRFSSVTHGAQGITLPPLPELTLYYLTWGIAALVVAVAYFALRGSIGRCFRALRDSHVAAVSFGINPVFYKTLAFGWSAMYAGIAGALVAASTAYVSPDVYGVALSLNVLVGAVVGGLDMIWGAIVGAIVIEFLPIWSQSINPAFSPIVYGIVLVLVMIFMPGGIAGSIARRLPSPHRSPVIRRDYEHT